MVKSHLVKKFRELTSKPGTIPWIEFLFILQWVKYRGILRFISQTSYLIVDDWSFLKVLRLCKWHEWFKTRAHGQDNIASSVMDHVGIYNQCSVSCPALKMHVQSFHLNKNVSRMKLCVPSICWISKSSAWQVVFVDKASRGFRGMYLTIRRTQRVIIQCTYEGDWIIVMSFAREEHNWNEVRSWSVSENHHSADLRAAGPVMLYISLPVMSFTELLGITVRVWVNVPPPPASSWSRHEKWKEDTLLSSRGHGSKRWVCPEQTGPLLKYSLPPTRPRSVRWEGKAADSANLMLYPLDCVRI